MLHLSLRKRIVFIAIIFFIHPSCRKEIDQAAKLKVTDASPTQLMCDTLNRATITIQLVPVASIPTPRHNITTATAGNKLLLAGGSTYDDVPVSDVDIYDFGTQTWSTVHFSTTRTNMTLAAVGNKIVFVAGGVPGLPATTRVDIYDAPTSTWSFSDLPSPASTVFSYAVVGNKVFFVTDRSKSNRFCISCATANDGTVDVYDTSTGLWSEINLPEHQSAPTATTVHNKVYFAGGFVNYPALIPINVVDIYDNATDTWSTTSSLSQPTRAMGSIYANGKIYWAGGEIGYDTVSNRDIATCKVEIRDVSTGISSFTNLRAPREFEGRYSKPIYYNNKLIFQGWRGNYYFDIYDLQNNTWSIVHFPQNASVESLTLVNNALYAIGYNARSSNAPLSDQIWKLQY